jgi:hypothetical protein
MHLMAHHLEIVYSNYIKQRRKALIFLELSSSFLFNLNGTIAYSIVGPTSAFHVQGYLDTVFVLALLDRYQYHFYFPLR